jgi:hypothetical protein
MRDLARGRDTSDFPVEQIRCARHRFIDTIRAYTDPEQHSFTLHGGLTKVGEIELIKPTRHGARSAPLFLVQPGGLEAVA